MKSEEYEIEEATSTDDMDIAERIIANMLVKQWLAGQSDAAIKDFATYPEKTVKTA